MLPKFGCLPSYKQGLVLSCYLVKACGSVGARSARGLRVATIDINRSPHMNMLSDAGFLCCA